MKILFLSCNNMEHMADMLYNGLVELYGHDSVIDFPRKPRYHIQDPENDHQVLGGGYFSWVFCKDENADKMKHYSLPEIKQMINNKEIDLIITSIHGYHTFVEVKKDTIRVPTIVVSGDDMSDEHYLTAIRPHFMNYWYDIEMILQREYKYNIKFERKVVPHTCPCPVNNLPDLPFKKDKEIDVFCYLGNTHPMRAQVREKIAKMSGITFMVGRLYDFNRAEYFKHMNNSKICIAFGGQGWESTHYLDIPLAKSMLLAQSPANAVHSKTLKEEFVVYPNNFKHQHSAVFYKNDLSDLEELVRYYLAHDDEREIITRNGYEHLMSHLTTKHIAEYVMKCKDNLDYWKQFI